MSGPQPSLIKRTTSMSAKATAVLKRIKFFQELEPGVQSKLPSIVTMEHVTAGTVIFRQDDPPGNCYVLLNGEVGVFVIPKSVEEVVDGDEDAEAFSRKSSTRMSMIEKFQEIKLQRLKAEYEAEAERRSSTKAETITEAEEGEDGARNDGEAAPPQEDLDADAELKVSRRRSSVQPPKVYQTTEGFSVWSDIEDLGKKQVSLREGTIFGELALINDQLRGASIRCLTDCDLLVIRRSDFDRVLKEEMRRAGDEKLNFLAEHLPGMRDVDVPRQIQGKGQPHPAYYLRRATYRRGHQFFTQGVVAQDAIFVVSKGSVEIRREDQSSPSVATTRLRTQARRGRSLGMRGYQSQPDNNNTAKGGPRILGTLMRGSVLGSLPVQAAEPFSLIVSSPSCEVFQAIGPDVLKLPRRLLEVVREYIANSTAWRLQTYMNHKSDVAVPKAPARSESPQVSSGPRSQLDAKCFRLIHAS